TRHGYSGPAVLDISHAVSGTGLFSTEIRTERGAVPRVRWSELDAARWTNALSNASGQVLTAVSREIPPRLAERLLIESNVPVDRRASALTRGERLALIDRLTSYELPCTGHEGYKKAEVTGGGIALDELDHRSLESRITRGVFFCGEILDAFGPIGGHNFAWAWATGRAAGLGASR